MRVIQVESRGGPEVLSLAELPAPQPGPGQIVAQIGAAGVNYMDIYQREGVGGYGRPVPFVTGGEGAGTVVAVGEGVTSPAVGDRVAWVAPGSYAEQVVLPADRVVPVPPGISTELAAAAILQGMTAHYLVTSTYPVRPGDVVVVHAAAGGVGLLLTQMVKRRGGTVVATCSGGEDGGRPAWRATPAPPTWLATTGARPSSARSPAVRARTWCTTAWARPPSTTAWPRCGRAGC